ncbi:hypothetical protein CRE_23316 [Caenorhabditis remanei]|uniref:Seven TM Receptor n=1 Tax=Caenorhabditis remanei TaxID=31234 RepID=E3MGR7_CAERE|nr:hypothetical protein CRE_23316 [Caenorhabditis remanei]
MERTDRTDRTDRKIGRSEDLRIGGFEDRRVGGSEDHDSTVVHNYVSHDRKYYTFPFLTTLSSSFNYFRPHLRKLKKKLVLRYNNKNQGCPFFKMPTSFLRLVSIAQTIGTFAFIISSFFGIIVIFLTLFGVRKIFGTYKYLIVTFTTIGIGLACLEGVFHPNLHFYNNGFVFFSLSFPFGLSKETLKLILPMYAGVYSVTISMLAVQFIYRYWALFSLNHLTYFHGFKSLIWAVYCIFFGGIWWIGAYNLMEMDDAAEKYFDEEMLIRYSVSVKEIPAQSCLAYEPEGGLIRWKNASYTVLISSIMAFQYGVMIFCGWNMHSKMEQKIAGFSVALKHHNRQLFKTLVFQISTPTIFLFSPLILVIYLPYFQIELSFPAGATVALFNMYPALDSIIVLIIVTEYRIAARSGD